MKILFNGLKYYLRMLSFEGLFILESIGSLFTVKIKLLKNIILFL